MSKARTILSKIKNQTQQKERLQMYNPQKRELSFACGDGENGIYISAEKQLRKAETVFRTKLTPKIVEKFLEGADDVYGEKLFKKILNIYKHYIWHEDERLYLLQSTWTIGTYLFTIFSHFGYQFLHSTLPRSAKSRVEEIISHLAYESTELLNSPTAPYIRETVDEGRTILLDTLERLRMRSTESYGAILELQDAGFRNGGTVAVMVRENGTWKKRVCAVYSPYGMAAIGKDSLSATALDRAFCIEMKRKPLKVKKAKYNYFQCEKKCLPIREDCYLWALQNAKRVAEIYGSKELEKSMELLGLNDRAFDIWMPLFAVLQGLGFNKDSQEWKELSALAIKMHRDPEIEEAERQLESIEAVRGVMNGEDRLLRMTSELTVLLGITDKQVGELMDQWGCKQIKARHGDSKDSRRVWSIPRSKLGRAEATIKSYYPQTLTTLTTTRKD